MAWNNSDKSDDRARLMREYDQMCGSSHRRDLWLYLSVFVCIWTVALWFVFNGSIGNSSDQVAVAETDKSVERLTYSEDERLAAELSFADGRKRRLSDLIRAEDLLAEEEFRHGSVGKGPPYDIWYEFCSSNDWNVSRDSFVIGHQGVGRSDVSSKEVRLFGDGIRFHGFPTCEARVRFRDGRATDVFVSVFNKGDMKCLLRTSSAYRYIADFKGMMTENGTPLSASEKVSIGANEWMDYYVWTESIPKFILSCGYARTSNDVVVEFVNVHMFVNEEECLPKTAEQFLVNRIEDDGDVWIAGVPMVDQGQKGYCVPATLERELRYLGLRADMHELALALQTKYRGSGGTPIEESMQGLDYATASASLNRIDCFEMSVSDDDVLQWYNMAAAEAGLRALDPEDFLDEHEDEQGEIVSTVNWDRLRSRMDRTVLDKCREFDQHGLEMFAKGVQAAVDSGLPLVWCVKKSLPSEERFFSDGHMRMIIGYNTDRQEILYTDSWGMGHELKRASIKKAFGVTEFCTCLVPSWSNY